MRDLPPELADALWGRLRKMGSLLFRRVPVAVTLERTDGAGGSITVRKGPEGVTLRGPAGELMLRAYGRKAVNVDVIGSPEAVAAFESASLGI